MFGDFSKPCLVGVRKAAASAGKGYMIAVEKLRLFGVEAECPVLRVERIDTTEQSLVQVDAAAMPGEFWRDLAFDCFNLVIGIGSCKIEKNRGNTLEKEPAPFKRNDRIFERRPLWIGSNVCYFGLRKAERCLKGFDKVTGLYAIERRRFKSPCPRRKQRGSS